MNQVEGYGAAIAASFDALLAKAAAFLPQLVGAAALIVIGWLAARALRAIVLRLARTTYRFAGAIGLGQAVGSDAVRESAARIVAGVVYWTILLVFVTVAASLLGMGMFTTWLDTLVGYLPNLLAAIIVVLVGILLAGAVRNAVTVLAADLVPAQRATLGRAAQILTLATAGIIAVNQIGIDVSLVNTIVAVVVAAFLGGLSLAFGLGARGYVGNLMGVRYLGPEYRVGEHIRVGEHEGTIIEVTPTSVVLETADGRTRIPGRLFDENPSLIVERSS